MVVFESSEHLMLYAAAELSNKINSLKPFFHLMLYAVAELSNKINSLKPFYFFFIIIFCDPQTYGHC